MYSDLSQFLIPHKNELAKTKSKEVIKSVIQSMKPIVEMMNYFTAKNNKKGEIISIQLKKDEN